ncbi:MAG: VOC family protein [Bdellovibrionales bacterium]|nr:VOC family protein [Bdellovibrionales bacterium]
MKRLNIITLGVKNLIKSRSFYESLFDWKPKDEESKDIAFYNMGGWMIALYPRNLLAEDITIPADGNGFSGITLAHNVVKKSDVKKILDRAKSLGANIIKPAQDVFWGGYSGYFQDIDGHFWEVAYNPFTKTLEDGTLDLPKI